KVCIQCDKEFILATEKADAKLRFSKKATSRFINEEGRFSCGNHRRDDLCNDCFQIAVDHDKEQQRRRRIMDGAVKRIWRKIYLKEGDEVPWSKEEEEEKGEDEDEEEDWETDKDEDEDDDVPLDNAQQQIEQKTCAYCGKIGNFDRCAKCKVVFYCSRSHQAADYAKHKAYCRAPKTLPTHMTKQLNIADGDEATNPPAVMQVTGSPKEDMKGGPSAGSNDTPNEKPPLPTWCICALCGTKSDKLSRCSRCKCTWYCSADHQRAHYFEHKIHCRLIADMAAAYAQPPAVPTNLCHPHIWANRTVCLHNRNIIPKESPVISWRELEGIHPNVAIGRTLEVRLVSDLTEILPTRYEGKDAEGVVRVVAFYTFRPPEGLKKGCVLRWRNPWFYRFAHGGSGANIEQWDLPNVTVSAA
ncbi:hypothetical protein M758_2G080300, partial [Ceratodon purpureus]